MKAALKIVSGVFMAGMILTSCVKKNQEADETDSATENFTATSISNDMGNISDEAGRTKGLSSFKSSEDLGALTSSCATLKFDTLVGSNPDSITINFGAVNCVGNDGNSRRGSILVVYSGKYKDSLANITITSTNYFVNDHGVSGTKTIKNLGHNAQGHLVYDMTESITINKPAGGTIKFDGKRQREWVSGESTLVWFDDKYSITGSASGTNANGRTFTSLITKPLIRDMSFACRKHFISGTLVHTPSNKPARTVDFGNGACDGKATVTINGKTYEVNL